MKRTTIQCTICDRLITRPNYSRHYDRCSGTNSIVYKPKTEAFYTAMVAKRGTTARNHYSKAKELGLPKPEISEETRMKIKKANSRPCSEETKKKISAARIKFLNENPDMVPYKLNHHSKGRSYPEKYWKEVLDERNVTYEEQYRIGLYQLDFAIVEHKIDLEIDGEQHYADHRIVASDIRRTAYLAELGWKTIRVRWAEYQKLTDRRAFVDELIDQITKPWNGTPTEI